MWLQGDQLSQLSWDWGILEKRDLQFTNQDRGTGKRVALRKHHFQADFPAFLLFRAEEIKRAFV